MNEKWPLFFTKFSKYQWKKRQYNFEETSTISIHRSSSHFIKSNSWVKISFLLLTSDWYFTNCSGLISSTAEVDQFEIKVSQLEKINRVSKKEIRVKGWVWSMKEALVRFVTSPSQTNRCRNFSDCNVNLYSSCFFYRLLWPLTS